MDHGIATFPNAGQPDIVRAAQKDEFYMSYLSNQFTELYTRIFGNRNANKHQSELKLLSDFCYYALTTLAGYQTLGEEYCDILQVKTKDNIPPSLRLRAVLLFWSVLFPYGVDKGVTLLLQHLRRTTTNHNSNNNNNNDGNNNKYSLLDASSSKADPVQVLSKKLRSVLLTVLPHVKKFIPYLARFHLALFYINGIYLDISKRSSGIKFIHIGRREPRPSYRILGLLILLQQSVQLFMWINSLRQHRPLENNNLLYANYTHAHGASSFDTGASSEDDDLASSSSSSMSSSKGGGGDVDEEAEAEDGESPFKCSLCLGRRRHTTATSCGHLFCWTCITEWCNNQAKCPLCRQPSPLQTLVRVYHYDAYSA